MKPEKKTWYYDNGKIEEERHYLDGKLHRENEPAIIYYDEEGNIWSESWYVNGYPLNDKQIAAIKKQKR